MCGPGFGFGGTVKKFGVWTSALEECITSILYFCYSLYEGVALPTGDQEVSF